MKKPVSVLALALVASACGNDADTPERASTTTEQPQLAQDQSSPSVAHEQDVNSTLVEVWETGGLRTPESVLYHETDSGAVLFVSEIEGEGNAEDGQGGIARMSPDGEILEQDWVRGLNAPKGMAIHNGALYVADLHEVLAIDLESGEIKARVRVPDSVFLNDVAIDEQGAVFVSDTRTNKIHRIYGDSSEVYLENVEAANGLTFVDGTLYVAAADSLWRVEDDQQLTRVAQGFEERADGVERIDDNTFIVSNWAGLVYQVHSNGQMTQLLDTRGDSNTADIGWSPQDEILYVPTFNANSVVAYQLTN